MAKTNIRTDKGVVKTSLDHIPEEILTYGFEFEIDMKKVWALDAPAIHFPVAELLWHMDITPWDNDGKACQIGPREVIAEPEKYPYHFGKIANADQKYPLDIAFNNGRWVIVDGLHRLSNFVLNCIGSEANLKVRVHSREAIISCMDLECTPKSIAQRYLSPSSLSRLQAPIQSTGTHERPNVLKPIAENSLFKPEFHLSPVFPAKVKTLEELGYSREFTDQLACKIAYTTAFPLLSADGLKALQEIAGDLAARKKEAPKGPLFEFGAAAYLSPFMEAMAKDSSLKEFLSKVVDCPVVPYVRKHFLAALNIGTVKEGKPVRNWHNDYQSLNLIVFLDEPDAHKGGKLQFYNGTKEEADFLMKQKGDLPESKLETVVYPKAGYAVFAQGSLVKHAVTPLQNGDPDRFTLVLGYRGSDLTKGVVEHTGIAPDHPLCRYPEAAKQAASITIMRLNEFISEEIYTDNPQVVSQLLENSLREVNEIASKLKELPSPER